MTFAPLFRRSDRGAWAGLAITGLAALAELDTADAASAKGGRDVKREEFVQSRPAGPPVLAVVSLSRQRVTIYDADGAIMRAPVSSGMINYETPAGVYSILQKKAEHYSNLYDDASMPFMQRLTWSGIALHAGALPGRPASHGCVRMPLDFAERLFDVTRIGMRVVVMRDDLSPVDLVHPLLFKPGVARQPELATAAAGPSHIALDAAPSVTAGQSLRAAAAAKVAETTAANEKAREARMLAAKQAKEVARAIRTLRMAEGSKMRTEAQLRVTETQLAMATSPESIQRAEEAKALISAKLAEAQALAEKLEREARPIQDAAMQLREQAMEAERARQAAEEQSKDATRKLLPISVFVSRKTQRVYVRQAREPLFDTPVTIADADAPLGTYVFTALAFTNDEKDLRWTAVSLYDGAPAQAAAHVKGQQRRGPADANATATDAAAAAAALDRIVIPQEAIDRISEAISPGSALIISDEDISRETGSGTDFIIVMSTEPQGGIKMRRREPEARNYHERPFGRGPYGWGSSFWK